MRIWLFVGLFALIACSASVESSAVPTQVPVPTSTQPQANQASSHIGSCPLLPSDNIWNVPINTLPVHSRSAQYITSIGASGTLHPDFGSALWNGGPIGLPYVVVPATQATVSVEFVDYPDESDPLGGVGMYPIPANAPVEHGGDQHVLVVREGECILYELFNATKIDATHWQASNGAMFDLRSNALRPDGWTSADAAGLPILPGLVRYEEVQTGAINHALRFTVAQTQSSYVWPARHQASSNPDLNLPPMGTRFRLKAGFDITPYSPEVQVILQALKTYGMILADNGSNWYLSGAPNPQWNDDDLVSALGSITGDQFEAVDVSSLMLDADSGQVAIYDQHVYIALVAR